MDHKDEALTNSGGLSPKGLRIADLLEALTPEQVDLVLDLKPGTASALAQSDVFLAAVEKRQSFIRNAAPSADYSKALDEKRAEAARAMVLDGKSQAEAAKIVGVNDRSIRHWSQQVVFTRYIGQLREEKTRDEAAKREAKKDEVDAILSEGRVQAAHKLIEHASDGNLTAIQALLKSSL